MFKSRCKLVSFAFLRTPLPGIGFTLMQKSKKSESNFPEGLKKFRYGYEISYTNLNFPCSIHFKKLTFLLWTLSTTKIIITQSDKKGSKLSGYLLFHVCIFMFLVKIMSLSFFTPSKKFKTK